VSEPAVGAVVDAFCVTGRSTGYRIAVANTEEPRLDQVVALTAEICALNEAIRRAADGPAAQRHLRARRDELLERMYRHRAPTGTG
jgi:transcriptional regulator of nitric oxide reductase